MIRAVIIDDAGKARTFIKNILRDKCPWIKVVGEAFDVASGMSLIMEDHPDLVLLDVEMPDGNGFDLLEQLPSIPFKVIFITAYKEFAYDAIKVDALDYIVKPIDPEALVASMQKATKVIEKEIQLSDLDMVLSQLNQVKPLIRRIILKSVDRYTVIDPKNIVRCESAGSYTKLFLANGKEIIESKTLKEIEKMLDSLDFLRVHNSHLINLQYLETFEKTQGNYAKMADGSKIPVSKRKKDQLLNYLNSLS